MAVAIESRTYTDKQRAEVIAYLDGCRGPEHETTTDTIEQRCGIGERELRDLMSDLDGEIVDGWPFVICYRTVSVPYVDDRGRRRTRQEGRVWLATSRAEATDMTCRLRHQAYRMNTRCDRREQAYRLLGEPQGSLL